MSAEVLRRESASLVARLRLWTPARWAAAASDGALPAPGTRGDLVFHLATCFARRAGAPAELPRLDNDLALPDQLAVTADDLVRTGPGRAQVVDAVAHLLLHREHLLDEPPPTGLVEELDGLDRVAPDNGRPDGPALVRRGRRVCGAASAEPEGLS